MKQYPTLVHPDLSLTSTHRQYRARPVGLIFSQGCRWPVLGVVFLRGILLSFPTCADNSWLGSVSANGVDGMLVQPSRLTVESPLLGNSAQYLSSPLSSRLTDATTIIRPCRSAKRMRVSSIANFHHSIFVYLGFAFCFPLRPSPNPNSVMSVLLAHASAQSPMQVPFPTCAIILVDSAKSPFLSE